MKPISFIGRHSRNSDLLKLQARKTLCKDLCGYQLVERNGEILSRKIDPKLRKASPSNAIKMAKEIIAFEPPSREMAAIVGERKLTFFSSYAKSRTHTLHGRPVLNIAVEKDRFPDILDIVCELGMAGYSFYLCSSDQTWDDLLTLTKFREPDAPVGICLTDSGKPGQSIGQICDNLWRFVRVNIPPPQYCTHMICAYQGWRKNFYLLPDKRNLFLSCSRATVKCSETQRQIFEALEKASLETLLLFPRKALEDVFVTLEKEDWKNQYFESLMNTNLARIENYSDVIVSFLGSHRCNLRCKYCFSNHTCEALSTMTSSEAVEITDMLTQDRSNLNLHVDNNLGGEPLLDFKAVQERHDAMVAYHKVRGIKASFGLLTNGTLLEPEHLEWLRNHIPYVGFSLDGSKETNDRIRMDVAGNGTYDRAVQSIKLLQQSDWPVELGISSVISKYDLNILSIQNHIRDELSVPNLVMKPVRAAADSDFALAYGDLEELKDGYRRSFDYLLAQGRRKNLKPLFSMLQPLDYAGRFFIRVFLADRVIVKRCGSGEHIFSVADDASVYPCDSFNGVSGFEIANLQEGMHNRPGYRVPFVNEENEAFGCKNCWARYLCGGICQYVQYLNGYAHNDVTKMECGLARFLIESAILFWQEARDCWESDLLEQVRERICKIGFRILEDRDSFVYAPC